MRPTQCFPVSLVLPPGLHRRVAARALLVVLLGLGLSPEAARTESVLRVPEPRAFGAVEAATYDEAGDRVGPASMDTERLPDGRVRLSIASGFQGAAGTRAFAILEPRPDSGGLRLVAQESRSLDEDGSPLGVLSIDHLRGVATCTPPDDSGKPPKRFELPDHERVANVPLALLFQDLVTGRADEVSFQIFVCTGGPRVLDARARRHATLEGDGAQPGLVEIDYDFDLGRVLGAMMRPFLPRMAVWFDPDQPNTWVGHRVPLYGRGPTVLVVRAGVSPERFLETP